jgi:hypothetical protein
MENASSMAMGDRKACSADFGSYCGARFDACFTGETMTEPEKRWMPGYPVGFHEVSYPNCHAPSEKVAKMLDEARREYQKAQEKTHEGTGKDGKEAPA